MVSQKGNMTGMENCNIVFALLIIFKTYEKVIYYKKCLFIKWDHRKKISQPPLLTEEENFMI